jgi:hypothetical protein
VTVLHKDDGFAGEERAVPVRPEPAVRVFEGAAIVDSRGQGRVTSGGYFCGALCREVDRDQTTR